MFSYMMTILLATSSFVSNDCYIEEEQVTNTNVAVILTKCSVILMEGVPNTDDEIYKAERIFMIDECHKINRLHNKWHKVCNEQSKNN